MRSVPVRRAAAGAAARIRRRVVPGRSLRRLHRALVLSAVLLGCWLLVARGPLPDGAALGLLAAGGWGLGLIPVHADPLATGPVRRTGETAAPVEQPSPIE